MRLLGLMLYSNHGVNPTANVKIPDDSHRSRMTGPDQVVEDPVDDVFVEGPFRAEGPKIKLKGFELDTQLVWDITDANGGKVGLSGARAHTSKLGTLHADFIIPTGTRVREGLQALTWHRGHKQHKRRK